MPSKHKNLHKKFEIMQDTFFKPLMYVMNVCLENNVLEHSEKNTISI